MTALRVYTILDATLPAAAAVAGSFGVCDQTRLWVIAGSKREARQMLTARGITFREETFAGPVGVGPFVAAARRCGLLDAAAVYAYPIPHTPTTLVTRVDSPTGAARIGTTMGDLLGHLVGAR